MAPRRSPWPYLAHLPFVAWTFAGPLFFGLVPYFRDIAYYYYPNEVFLERSFREGVWPLWNPTSDAGAPFLTTDVAELLLVRATSALSALRFGPPLHQLVAELRIPRHAVRAPERDVLAHAGLRCHATTRCQNAPGDGFAAGRPSRRSASCSSRRDA